MSIGIDTQLLIFLLLFFFMCVLCIYTFIFQIPHIITILYPSMFLLLTVLLDRVESKAIHLTNSSSHWLSSASFSLLEYCILLSSIVIFMPTTLMILLTACLPSSSSLTTQGFHLSLPSIPSTSHHHNSCSLLIFTHSCIATSECLSSSTDL